MQRRRDKRGRFVKATAPRRDERGRFVARETVEPPKARQAPAAALYEPELVAPPRPIRAAVLPVVVEELPSGLVADVGAAQLARDARGRFRKRSPVEAPKARQEPAQALHAPELPPPPPPTRPPSPPSEPPPRKVRKPRKPGARVDDARRWREYFETALGTLQGELELEGFRSIPRAWSSKERADGTLLIEVPKGTDVHELQRELGDLLIQTMGENPHPTVTREGIKQRARTTPGGYYLSIIWQGQVFERGSGKKKKGSPTLLKAGSGAESWPSQEIGAAISNAGDILENLDGHLDVTTVSVRLHWNPYGEQPERME